jgi:hypothetical protein
MSLASNRSLRILMGGAISGLLAIALAAGPALADYEVKHKGQIGVYDLHDANGDIVCNYMQGAPYDLLSVSIGAPYVYARNRTAGVDHQRVGWRYILKRHKTGDIGMTVIKKSKIFKANATDATPAPFFGKTPTVASVDGTEVYVFVKLYWYNANGTVAGWALDQAAGYTENNVDYNYWPLDYCPPEYDWAP